MIGLSRDAAHIYSANYDGQSRIVPGVTTVLRVLDKPALMPWAQGLVAEAAIKNRGNLEEWVQVGGVEGAVSLLRKAAETQRDKAANVGSEVHALAEALVKGQQVTVPQDIAPFVTSYLNWQAAFAPEFIAVEEMVYSEAGYAGTFDAICVIAGETWLLDYKTARGTYSDTSLQLAAYAFADWIGRPGDETKYAIPPIDQFGVVHIRPEGAELVPYDVTDREYEAFLALLRAHTWRQERAKTVMGQAIGPGLLNFQQRRTA